MRLRFGSLEDIILIKKEEIRMLQTELDALIIRQSNDVENCELRLGGISCDDCVLNKQCREDSLKFTARIDILEDKIRHALLSLKYLFLELFISQNKGAYIKYIGLELFP